MRRASVAALALAAMLLAAAPLMLAQDKPTVVLIRAGSLVDVAGGTVRAGQDILVEGTLIKKVGASLAEMKTAVEGRGPAGVVGNGRGDCAGALRGPGGR